MKVTKTSSKFSSENVKRIVLQVKDIESGEELKHLAYSDEDTRNFDEIKKELDSVIIFAGTQTKPISVSLSSWSNSHKGAGEHVVETKTGDDREAFEANLKTLRHLFILTSKI